MIIVGIDYSKNSPGLMKSTLNENFDIINIEYMGFSSVKKIIKLDNNIIYYQDSFTNDIDKSLWFRDNIIKFINGADYCAMEGYAFKAIGKVFDIAESTMCTKLGIYDLNIPLRIYEPSTIKKLATGNGNSGKVEMCDSYFKYHNVPNLSHLPLYKNPLEDLIDAYYCMKLLQLELSLRFGINQLRDLDNKIIEIFNRVTKAYPENILVRPFIVKNKE